MQNSILYIHNFDRNELALGNTFPGYDPAAKMATMRWDPTLAALCDLKVRDCTLSNDGCVNTRNLYEFSRK